jgi:L,D-peptidoglycan transpeptidase YkuD (ErfK/YbiS/YcfS/YnhG family)
LRRFEKTAQGWRQVGDEYPVSIGREGLGKTREGDGKTPVGVYPLTAVYAPADERTAMPFFLTHEDLICVDDARSRYYNRIVDRRYVKSDYQSFEKMLRPDGLYRLVVTVGYNPKRLPGKGSCIFMHVANATRPTAGCVAMKEEVLRQIVRWLDPAKRPVIVIERWLPSARFARR